MNVKASIDKRVCELTIKLQKPGWIIRSVVLFSDTLFAGGSFAVHATESSNTVVVPLSQSKNGSESIDIRLLIGAGINAPFFTCVSMPNF